MNEKSDLRQGPQRARPKSETGQSRSAEALRANLLKRKAQKRARDLGDDTVAKPPKSA